MDAEIVGRITDVETIAAGTRIRELRRLRRFYGGRRWRKLKGLARVRYPDGRMALAEVHWYEGHGVGRVELKIKTVLE